MYHSRVSSTSCSLANSASISASGSVWNARSHAAYHGYSHLSGIEMMSALLRWSHSQLRPCLRCRRRRDLRLVALQPLGHVEVEELLAPDHSGERLPLHQAAIGIGKVVLDLARRTRRLRARARRRLHRSPRMAARELASIAACEPATEPPAGTSSRYQAAAFVPSCAGFTARTFPFTTRS